MKKLCVIILLSYCVFCSLGMSPALLVGVQDETIADYSDITFWWGCETDTAEHCDGEDSGAAYVSGAEINTDAVEIGTNGLDCPSSLDHAQFTDSTDGGWPVASFRIGFYLYVNTWVNEANLCRQLNGAEYLYLRLRDDEELHFYHVEDANVDQFATTTADMSTGTWYYIELAFDAATNYQEIFVDGVSKGTGGDTLDAFTAGGDMEFGEASGVAGSPDFYIDQIIISNDYERDLNALKDTSGFPG